MPSASLAHQDISRRHPVKPETSRQRLRRKLSNLATGDPPPKKRTPARSLQHRGGGETKYQERLAALSNPPGSAPQAWHAHLPRGIRRRKTIAELLEGHELVEIYDRAFPGRLTSGRAAR
jgi:hypothetical protein